MKAHPDQCKKVGYFYLDRDLSKYTLIRDICLQATRGRHLVRLPIRSSAATSSPLKAMEVSGASGAIIETSRGWLSLRQFDFLRQCRKNGHSVWLYRVKENALDFVDDALFISELKLLLTMNALRVFRKKEFEEELKPPVLPPTPDPSKFARSARPVPLKLKKVDDKQREFRIDGSSIYLRTDYWAKLIAGGSYGHTCFLARELAAVSDDLFCFMGTEFPMLDRFGLKQASFLPRGEYASEEDLLSIQSIYYVQLVSTLKHLRPALIYERLCMGNFVGAQVSRELGIPYIIEYNGSELDIKRSFEDTVYQQEQLFEKIEMAAFQQASLVSVVSEPIRQSLISRGVDADKIVTVPNSVDTNFYQPPDEVTYREGRANFGWDQTNTVVGFIGTFGGWHGVDVLADALPKIHSADPNIRFLIIGSGNLYDKVVDAVHESGLEDIVKLTGTLPQEEAPSLLQLCDILVSPHNKLMNSGEFFGSPTKIFEYMALGKAIVASNLGQIGEVLTPALHTGDGEQLSGTPNEACAVLTAPGDLAAFVSSIVHLADAPELRATLGANARRKAIKEHTWITHLQCVLHAAEQIAEATPETATDADQDLPDHRQDIEDYKTLAARHWDADPCGSHYAEDLGKELNLAWFEEVERYRYQSYAPWMHKLVMFEKFRSKDVLEIGSGLGTDSVQFAKHGANVSCLDLSLGHLNHAKKNFELRGLSAKFIHGDAEELCFHDASFDAVYSNGVLHHTPNIQAALNEVYRVLKPGGSAVIMLYAENSLHYWRQLFYDKGVRQGEIFNHSIGDIMSRHVELSQNGGTPLVEAFTGIQARTLFKNSGFESISINKCQMTPDEVPWWLKPIPLAALEKLAGWNLLVKAQKPANRGRQ